MRVWLVNSNEPMPIEDEKQRLWRMGYTAKLLSEKGHEVMWWGTNFNHFRKAPIQENSGEIKVADNYTIYLLPSIGYKKNVSFRRFLEHRLVAKEFKKIAKNYPKPDIILSSYPTIDLSQASIDYGKENNVPVVVDVRDLWPEVLYDMFPSSIRWALELIGIPVSRQADYIFKNANAITAHAPAAIEWALKKGGRKRSELDKDFPMAYPVNVPDDKDIKSAEKFWHEKGIYEGCGKFLVVFLGSLSKQFDFDTLVRSAGLLSETEDSPLFVICGRGELLDSLEEQAKDLNNVIFPGWVDAAQIHVLLRLSSLGAVPYLDRENFENGITNKPIEYMSAGLPVLTSLRKGIMREILESHECGVFYPNGDPEKLAANIVEIQNDPERLQGMSKRALELFDNSFRADKVYSDMIDNLELVIKNNKS